MVEISPFKAIRFNENKLSNLSNIVCPPYDVISVPEYHRLLGSHPQNIVRVELPMAQGKSDKYQLSAELFRRWQGKRLLVRDKEPAFYGYEQRFTVGNRPYFRRGFFAALRLETPGRGRIRPHERTFPKHKEDRLRLMRATHANISPIFGIFFDSRGIAQQRVERLMTEKPLVTCRDDKGVTHRLWKWSDPDTIRLLRKVVASGDILIADGHHRYEPAWNYLKERLAAAKGKARSQASGPAYRYVLTFLCSLTDPGLVIQPTHRAVRWSAPLEEWEKRIAPFFSMQKLSSFTSLMKRLRGENEHFGVGFILQGGKLFWLKPKTTPPMMPVVALHEKILKDVPLEEISYGQDTREMVQNLQRGEVSAVFLLPPPEKEAFARICKAGRLLPQKSTYFYPKLATGLVLRSLDGHVSDL
jgi:uncharacterized protein (DUF1015 family)